jgi:hypothetical protein
MDKEVMEHELVLAAGNVVTIVRPHFGTQSDSWVGDLIAHQSYPIKFEVKSTDRSTMFTVEDVVTVTEPITSGVPYKLIIRLQGPITTWYEPCIG